MRRVKKKWRTAPEWTCRLSFGHLSADSWPYVGRELAVCWPTVGRLSAVCSPALDRCRLSAEPLSVTSFSYTEWTNDLNAMRNGTYLCLINCFSVPFLCYFLQFVIKWVATHLIDWWVWICSSYAICWLVGCCIFLQKMSNNNCFTSPSFLSMFVLCSLILMIVKIALPTIKGKGYRSQFSGSGQPEVSFCTTVASKQRRWCNHLSTSSPGA